MDPRTYPITVFYDEIYDSFFYEKKRKNYFSKIVRFPNPQLLLLKILICNFHLKDQTHFVPCSSFELQNTVIHCEGKQKSIYEMLLYLNQQYEKKNCNKNKTNYNKTEIKEEIFLSKEKETSLEFSKTEKESVYVESASLNLFYILNEFQDVYEYFLFAYSPCFEKYTKPFFLHTKLNYLKGYIKLKKHKAYITEKFKNISLSTILNKFIKLLISFQKTNISVDFFSDSTNCKKIAYIIYYVYAYCFLCVPIKLFPWDRTSDEWNQKIWKDGNVNMIVNTIAKNKILYASSFCSVPKKAGYFETVDFNIASLIEATTTKTKTSISQVINNKTYNNNNNNNNNNNITYNNNNITYNNNNITYNNNNKTYNYNNSSNSSNNGSSNSSRDDNNNKAFDMHLKTQNNISTNYISIPNEFIVCKSIGYNSLKQFYDTCFFYLTILKVYYLHNKKIEIVQNLFSQLVNYLVIMDSYFLRP